MHLFRSKMIATVSVNPISKYIFLYFFFICHRKYMLWPLIWTVSMWCTRMDAEYVWVRLSEYVWYVVRTQPFLSLLAIIYTCVYSGAFKWSIVGTLAHEELWGVHRYTRISVYTFMYIGVDTVATLVCTYVVLCTWGARRWRLFTHDNGQIRGINVGAARHHTWGWDWEVS